jgi:hypothetical protein
MMNNKQWLFLSVVREVGQIISKVEQKYRRIPLRKYIICQTSFSNQQLLTVRYTS